MSKSMSKINCGCGNKFKYDKNNIKRANASVVVGSITCDVCKQKIEFQYCIQKSTIKNKRGTTKNGQPYHVHRLIPTNNG